MCHQNSARFYKKVAYDTNYTGLADTLAEGRRLAGVMADKQVMMMGNHGILSVATSTALAFEYLYYFERSCMFQVCQVGLLNTLCSGANKLLLSLCEILSEKEKNRYDS